MGRTSGLTCVDRSPAYSKQVVSAKAAETGDGGLRYSLIVQRHGGWGRSSNAFQDTHGVCASFSVAWIPPVHFRGTMSGLLCVSAPTRINETSQSH